MNDAPDEVQDESQVLAVAGSGVSGLVAETASNALPVAQLTAGQMSESGIVGAAGVTGVGVTDGFTSTFGLGGTANTAVGFFSAINMPLLGLGLGAAVASIGRSDSDANSDTGARLSYTENRQPDSFIGSVRTNTDLEVLTYQFWDPVTRSRSHLSPDGFFRIDAAGRIFLTDSGAAAYVNDADDTQADGPLNLHTYLIQATTAQGLIPTRMQLALHEINCACDDPELQYLIDINGSGEFNRTLKDGRIDQGNEDLVDIEPEKQIIRMISTGGIESDDNKVALLFDFIDPENPDSPAVSLVDIACINLQASKRAELNIRTPVDIYEETLNNENMDYFLPSLEKVYLSTQMYDSPQYAYSRVQFDNYGSYAWMPKLKDITVLAGGDSARVTIYNNFDNGSVPVDILRGDDFMQALESIYMESYGTAALSITNQLGDSFMKSLKSITALGGSNGYGHTTLEFDNTAGYFGKRIEGDDGYTDGYMSALEVVTAKHLTGNAKIEFDNATSSVDGADNYMSSLSLIDIYSTTEEALYFRNGGGNNYMGSIAEINMTNSTRDAYFTAINTSRVDTLNQVLRRADDFMTGLKVVNIQTQGDIDFKIRNDKGAYYLNDDYSVTYYSPTGDNFMTSLKSISLDASGTNGDIKFELKVDLEDNGASLTSMESISILGGEIKAIFDTSLESTEWFDFGSIRGVADGELDVIGFDGSWKNDLIVIGGFDVGAVNDIVEIDVAQWAGHEITGIDDLIVTAEGENIRIEYADSLGYSGSIVLLGVAPNFDQDVNINFNIF